MDAERGTKGQGRPFVTCPRSDAGVRGVWSHSDQTRMQGWPSFGYFFLARQEKVTRRERRNLYSPPRKALRQALRYAPPRWKTLRGFPPYGSHPPEGEVGCSRQAVQ